MPRAGPDGNSPPTIAAARTALSAGRLVPWGLLGMLWLIVALERSVAHNVLDFSDPVSLCWQLAAQLAREEAPECTVLCAGDSLVKLDPASMAASLEARCPFLDHRMVEFAWRLPTAVKVREGQGKWLLRRVLARFAHAKVSNTLASARWIGIIKPEGLLLSRLRQGNLEPTSLA